MALAVFLIAMLGGLSGYVNVFHLLLSLQLPFRHTFMDKTKRYSCKNHGARHSRYNGINHTRYLFLF